MSGALDCVFTPVFAGAPTKGLIQRYGNIFGQPGEYSVDCMISCAGTASGGLSAMPLPIMSHQRSRYSVVNQVLRVKRECPVKSDFFVYRAASSRSGSTG